MIGYTPLGDTAKLRLIRICTVCFVPGEIKPLHFLKIDFIKWREEVVSSRCRGSKILGAQQTVVLQIWQKETKNLACLSSLWMIALRTKPVTFLPWIDNANGRLCQERLLRSRNFATMVTWRHTSFYTAPTWYMQEREEEGKSRAHKCFRMREILFWFPHTVLIARIPFCS